MALTALWLRMYDIIAKFKQASVPQCDNSENSAETTSILTEKMNQDNFGLFKQ